MSEEGRGRGRGRNNLRVLPLQEQVFAVSVPDHHAHTPVVAAPQLKGFLLLQQANHITVSIDRIT